ncbi:hypothetical protein XENTR_v10015260 [Xenopus tropicalis]|nr:dynein regulatory complex protein 1 [Xenopus tropicalis]KAE8605646.1 hypothetical protein XENTR_v10015260 [Xenopus tropicalis]
MLTAPHDVQDSLNQPLSDTMSLYEKEPGTEESAVTGPSLDAEDPQERIEARRLRIAARIEAKRREALGEDLKVPKEKKEEARKSHKQIEDSRQRLTKLVSDGTQLVTNIQIATDAKETQRRAEEEELKRQRREKLDTEAKSSLEKFDEITKKWALDKPKQVPQKMWEILNSQQQQCAHLIGDKNNLISELQKELRRKDDQYVKDLKKQAEDIDLLVERMEEQIKNLTKTYRQELLQIEKVFELERRELLTANRNKWEQGMEARRDKELETLMSRMRKVEEYEQQLKQLRVQDGEEYNMIKIKLEADVQVLQQQLQQMKATYQLNQEKLEYNYQVLKKRDEENTITKSQQKRKITRLQDVLNNLRLKQAKQVKQYKEENQSLMDDYKRIVEQYKELQKKMRHFSAVDAKMFEDIWLMNEEEMKQLVQKALEADRIIQEQQLGMRWEPPELGFLDNVGPLLAKQKDQKPAITVAQEVMSSNAHRDESPAMLGQSDGRVRQGGPAVSAQTVKHILELLCDESGFLIENKLTRLLSPLDKDERSLIKLDSIFGALGIAVEEDVYKLVEFFCRYKRERSAAKPDEDGDAGESNADSSAGGSHGPQGLIHPNEVLGAIKAFVMEFQKPRERTAPPRLMEERDSSEDATYWAAAAKAIPESRLRVWDALESALEKYHNVLSGRAQLITETVSLRHQNTELRTLLHQYLNSQVNAELEIPPTQMLQGEYSHT